MSAATRLVVFVTCTLFVGLGLPQVNAAEPIDRLVAVRDALRAEIDTRLAEDQAAAGREFHLTIDRGIGRKRRPMLLTLHYSEGTGDFPRASLVGLQENVNVTAVDASGLSLNEGLLQGDLSIDWLVDGEDGSEAKRQTLRLDARVTPTDRRLVLRLRRFQRGDWVLAYKPDGTGKWVYEKDLQTPRVFVDWGPFTRDTPDLVERDGRFQTTIKLTKQQKGHEDRLLEAYDKGLHPVIEFDFQIVSGRVGDIWTMRASGGKHMFGNGSDMLSGYISEQHCTGTYHSKGDRGEWTGGLRGPVLPAAASTAPVLAGEPAAGGDVALQAARVAHLFKQIAALDMVRRHYPLPVQSALDRVLVPAPAKGEASQVAAYAAELASYAEQIQAAPVDPSLTGMPAVDDPAFGPFFTPTPLAGNQMPAATADGAQQWATVGDWAFAGPFPVFDQNAPVHLPEIVHVDSLGFARERLFTVSKDGTVATDTSPAVWGKALQAGTVTAPPYDKSASSGDARYLVNYFHTTVDSVTAQEVWASLQVSGKLMLWLNGKLFLDTGDFTGIRPAVFKLPLVQGSNSLLVRCASSASSNRYYDLMNYTVGYDATLLVRSEYTSFSLNLATGGTPGTGYAGSKAGEIAAIGSGYRNDGSGVYPDADPPLAWNLEDGTNVLWRTDVPKGFADPVLRGGKLFIAAEPDWLICLDAESGKELWRSSASILPELGWQGDADALHNYIKARQTAASLQWAAREGDRKAQAAAKEQAKAELAKHAKIENFIKQHKLRLRNGWAGATPVVTDDAVFVTFGTGIVARFDHEGQQVWQRATGAPWSETNMGSPQLVGDLLIIQGHLPSEDGQYALLAYDAASGEPRWQCTGPAKRVRMAYERPTGLGNGFAPMHLANGDKRLSVLITGDGTVVDARDGKLLHRDILPIEANRSGVLVDADHVYAYSVTGETRVRLWLDEQGRVGAQTVWVNHRTSGRGRVKDNHLWGDLHWTQEPVLHEGLLYTSMVDNAHVPQHHPLPWLNIDPYDSETGKRRERLRGVAREASDPTVAPTVAGKYLIATDGGEPQTGFQGTTEYGQVCFIELGEHPFTISSSKITNMRAAPLPVGDKLYLRMFDSVVCLKDLQNDGGKYLEEVLAQKLFDQIPPRTLPPPVATIAADQNVDTSQGPYNQLKQNRLPTKWLVLGPLPAKPAGDPLADLGGEAKARPIAGSKTGEASFKKIDDKFFKSDAYGTPKHIDILGPIGKKTPSTNYFYTLLECTEPSLYKFSNPGKGYTAWLAGQEIKDGAVVRLELGAYPLLIKVPLGKLPPFMKKAMAIAPRFLRQKDPARDFDAWAETVRRNQQRLQRIIDKMPGSTWAGKASLVLGQLQQYDKDKATAP